MSKFKTWTICACSFSAPFVAAALLYFFPNAAIFICLAAIVVGLAMLEYFYVGPIKKHPDPDPIEVWDEKTPVVDIKIIQVEMPMPKQVSLFGRYEIGKG